MSKDQVYKADGGKIKPRLLVDGVPNALMAVSSVLTYGAHKYEEHSWKRVNIDRYRDAMIRHQLADAMEPGSYDDESGLLHLAHFVCNALFILEDRLSGMSKEERVEAMKWKEPPTGHKAQ